MTDRVYIQFAKTDGDDFAHLPKVQIRKWCFSPFEGGECYVREDAETAPEPAEQWIVWSGGDFMPVAPDTIVKVYLRSGAVEGPAKALEFAGADSCWKHRGTMGDIINYQIVATAPADRGLWDFWSAKAYDQAKTIDAIKAENARLREDLEAANADCTRANELINASVDDYNNALAENARLRGYLERIACPTQTTDLLWWQVQARAALNGEG